MTFSSFMWFLDHQLNYAFWYNHRRMPSRYRRKLGVRTYRIVLLVESLVFCRLLSAVIISWLVASFVSPIGILPTSSHPRYFRCLRVFHNAKTPSWELQSVTKSIPRC